MNERKHLFLGLSLLCSVAAATGNSNSQHAGGDAGPTLPSSAVERAVESGGQTGHPMATTATRRAPGSCRAKSEADLQSELDETNVLYEQLQDFVDTYGVEIRREANLVQKGEINGNISGSQSGSGTLVQLGNVASLVSGIANLGDGIARGLMPTIDEAAWPVPGRLIGNGVSGILNGIGGFGFGHMSNKGQLKGSLHGEFEGHGVQIHDTPSVFVVLVKNRKALQKMSDSLAPGKIASYRNAQSLEKLRDEVEKLERNPYIIGEDDLAKVTKAATELKMRLRCMNEIAIAHANSNEPIYRVAADKATEISAWLRGKTFTFAHLMPGKDDVSYDKKNFVTYEFKLRPQHDPKSGLFAKQYDAYHNLRYLVGADYDDIWYDAGNKWLERLAEQRASIVPPALEIPVPAGTKPSNYLAFREVEGRQGQLYRATSGGHWYNSTKVNPVAWGDVLDISRETPATELHPYYKNEELTDLSPFYKPENLVVQPETRFSNN